jgi:hypothetical protein
MGEIRQFSTGATRDQDQHKIDPEGFLSPLVVQAFCEYMHKNRFQSDGQIRDSDNWQKGIPLDAYMKSMSRHFLTIWQHHRGYPQVATESLPDALMALLFNVQGYMHELLVTMLRGQNVATDRPENLQLRPDGALHRESAEMGDSA